MVRSAAPSRRADFAPLGHHGPETNYGTQTLRIVRFALWQGHRVDRPSLYDRLPRIHFCRSRGRCRGRRGDSISYADRAPVQRGRRNRRVGLRCAGRRDTADCVAAVASTIRHSGDAIFETSHLAARSGRDNGRHHHPRMTGEGRGRSVQDAQSVLLGSVTHVCAARLKSGEHHSPTSHATDEWYSPVHIDWRDAIQRRNFTCRLMATGMIAMLSAGCVARGGHLPSGPVTAPTSAHHQSSGRDASHHEYVGRIFRPWHCAMDRP